MKNVLIVGDSGAGNVAKAVIDCHHIPHIIDLKTTHPSTPLDMKAYGNSKLGNILMLTAMGAMMDTPIGVDTGFKRETKAYIRLTPLTKKQKKSRAKERRARKARRINRR